VQVVWGEYAFPSNGVTVKSRRKTERGEDRLPYMYTDTIECEGYLEGSGQADLTAKQIAMMTAMKVPGKDLILKQDGGLESATVIRNAGSLSGTLIVDGPNFEEVKGPEYATQRKFRFLAEADYPMPTLTGTAIIDWSETITVSGGGPLYVVQPAIEGPPQRQKVYDQTPVIATQRGYAVGFLGPPAVPGAIWPFALKHAIDGSVTTPKKMGRGVYRKYRVEWAYSFEWTGPLVGSPTPWPIS